MELFEDLNKAFDVMWLASDNLTRDLDVCTRLPIEHHLQALRVGFRKAAEEGNQVEMLRLAGEMGTFGGDLASLKKQARS